MKCKNCGFDKQLSVFSDINNCYMIYNQKYCPECGTKFEEEIKPPWWCVPRITIRDRLNGNDLRIKNIDYDERKIYMYHDPLIDDTENCITFDEINNLKPISGPFAMIPKDALIINFRNDGIICFDCPDKWVYLSEWHDCPEEFKGKKFPITDDMR